MKTAVAALAILFCLAAFAASGEYWGSNKSNKYHYPTCRWAQKIKPANRLTFGSTEQAVKAGYVPCKVCKPK